MGMYDNIRDYEIKCPRCHEIFDYEIQTKELQEQPLLNQFEIRYPKFSKLYEFDKPSFARASKSRRYIHATFTCNSPSCKAIARMKEYLNGYTSGFGLSWDIRYKVGKNGFLIGPGEFVDWTRPWGFEKESFSTIYNRFVEKIAKDCKIDSDIRKKWNAALALGFNSPIMAVLYFHGESPELKIKRREAMKNYEAIRRKLI